MPSIGSEAFTLNNFYVPGGEEIGANAPNNSKAKFEIVPFFNYLSKDYNDKIDNQSETFEPVQQGNNFFDQVVEAKELNLPNAYVECAALSKKQKQSAHKKKVLSAKKNFVKYINKINPDYVIPFAGEVLMGGIKTAPYTFNGTGIGKKKDCVDYALKKVKFNYVLMSQKCIFDFKTKKFKGKFQDNNFLQYKKYLNLKSKKKK